MRKPIASAIGLIIGAFPTIILYIDGFWNPQLGLIIGITWAVAGWLYVRNRNVWGRNGSLWHSVFVVVVIGASVFGVHADLPIGEELRIALGMLVLGVGTAAFGIGVETTIDATSDTQSDITTVSD